MATEQRSSGNNAFLYFAVGALIVAVGVLGWMFYDGQWRQQNEASNAIERSADAIGDAADDVSDSVRDAARSAPAPQPAPAPATPPQPAPGG
jgi:predicted negative regulator of RcsB-dependent stress response